MLALLRRPATPPRPISPWSRRTRSASGSAITSAPGSRPGRWNRACSRRNATRCAALFHAASRAKRSKIGSFLALVEALDGALRFPDAIGERQGLALAKALDDDPDFGAELRSRLEAAGAGTPEIEQELISEALSPTVKETISARKAPQLSTAAAKTERTGKEIRPGLWYRTDKAGQVTLSGPAMTPELRNSLLDWLKTNG